MKTTSAHFFSRRTEAWQAEWEFLQRSLAREPDAVQAWWWKIRLRVLTFVIVRYGADPAVRARDHELPPRAPDGDCIYVERRTVEPRPRAALGAHLASIAAANDFPRPPVPPDPEPATRTSWTTEVFLCGLIVGTLLGAILGVLTANALGVEDSSTLFLIVAMAATFSGFAGGLIGARFSASIINWLEGR